MILSCVCVCVKVHKCSSVTDELSLHNGWIGIGSDPVGRSQLEIIPQTTREEVLAFVKRSHSLPFAEFESPQSYPAQEVAKRRNNTRTHVCMRWLAVAGVVSLESECDLEHNRQAVLDLWQSRLRPPMNT